MTKYRKKPVVIEAVRFDYTLNALKDLRLFVGDSLGKITKERRLGARAEAYNKNYTNDRLFHTKVCCVACLMVNCAIMSYLV